MAGAALLCVADGGRRGSSASATAGRLVVPPPCACLHVCASLLCLPASTPALRPRLGPRERRPIRKTKPTSQPIKSNAKSSQVKSAALPPPKAEARPVAPLTQEPTTISLILSDTPTHARPSRPPLLSDAQKRNALVQEVVAEGCCRMSTAIFQHVKTVDQNQRKLEQKKERKKETQKEARTETEKEKDRGRDKNREHQCLSQSGHQGNGFTQR